MYPSQDYPTHDHDSFYGAPSLDKPTYDELHSYHQYAKINQRLLPRLDYEKLMLWPYNKLCIKIYKDSFRKIIHKFCTNICRIGNLNKITEQNLYKIKSNLKQVYQL